MNRRCNILLVAAIISLLGCSKKTIDPVEPIESSPIRFGKVSTRAVVNDASQITEFAVFAEQNLGQDDTPEALEWISLLDGERVYADGDEYTYDNTRYWVDKRTFFFFGVYPYETAVTRTEETSGDGTKIIYNMPITVSQAADVDYMTAHTAERTDSNIPGEVGLQFSHKLSKIGFKVKKSSLNASNIITIKEIGLGGVSRSGSYTMTHEPQGSWSENLSSAAENRNVRRRNLDIEVTTEGIDVLESDGLLIVPQQLVSGQASINISYQYKQSSDSEVENLTFEAYIPTDQVEKWEAGMSYTYTLTLEKDDKIYISTPTVESWGSPQSGGIIIIK